MVGYIRLSSALAGDEIYTTLRYPGLTYPVDSTLISRFIEVVACHVEVNDIVVDIYILSSGIGWLFLMSDHDKMTNGVSCCVCGHIRYLLAGGAVSSRTTTRVCALFRSPGAVWGRSR